MANANFYLKCPNSKGQSLIYLQCKYKGQRMVIAFGLLIDREYWDAKKQRILENSVTTANGMLYINNLLERVAERFRYSFYRELNKGKVELKDIKEAIIKMLLDYKQDRKRLFQEKKRDGLDDSYINSLLLKNGWPYVIIREHPGIAEIKRIHLKSKRKIKSMQYDY